MFCQNCGVEMQDEWEFCPKCGGTRLKELPQAADDPNGQEGEPDSCTESVAELKPWSTVEYGSPWRRAGAEFVDLMLVGLLLQGFPFFAQLKGVALVGLIELVSIPYRVFAESSKYQATVGQMVVRFDSGRSAVPTGIYPQCIVQRRSEGNSFPIPRSVAIHGFQAQGHCGSCRFKRGHQNVAVICHSTGRLHDKANWKGEEEGGTEEGSGMVRAEGG